jgi:uncharacterized protein YegL
MAGEPIDNLNQGLQEFACQVRADPVLQTSLIIGLYGFGENGPIEEIAHFTPGKDFSPPKIQVKTGTPHCERLIHAVGLLAGFRTALIDGLDVDARHGWIVEFTDGGAQDLWLLPKATHASKVVAAELGVEMWFFGVPPQADLKYLKQLEQPGRPAQLLRTNTDFRVLFNWLFKSIRIVSQTRVGEEIEIPRLYDDSSR